MSTQRNRNRFLNAKRDGNNAPRTAAIERYGLIWRTLATHPKGL